MREKEPEMFGTQNATVVEWLRAENKRLRVALAHIARYGTGLHVRSVAQKALDGGGDDTDGD